jgi:hypothetical protein
MGIFLVFAGDCYYPCGGWLDYAGCFPTLELAKAFAEDGKTDWWHIVSGGQVVASS